MRKLVSEAKRMGRITFFCHQNADPDAVCSAIALRQLLEELAPAIESVVSCPMGISAPTRRLIRNLNLPEPIAGVKDELGLVVLVDTNTVAQLGDELSSKIMTTKVPVILVDHHHPHPSMEELTAGGIVDPSAASTAEIVVRLYRKAKRPIGLVMAEALLAAMFVETRNFILGAKGTFEAAASLVTAGAGPRRVAQLVGGPMTLSERIARLKAAERSKVTLVHEWAVASSEVGSHQSSAARALVMLGAHVAIVAGSVKGAVRVNLRSSEEFYTKTGLHLARDLAVPLGRELGGSGGGHPTAAGMSVHSTAENALEICVERVRMIVSSPSKRAEVQL